MQRRPLSSSPVRSGKERTLPIDKDLFADRLWSAIKRSGLTYKETARRAQEHLPPGSRISDVSVWSYAKGRSLPRRMTHVEALGKVLGIDAQELIGEGAPESGSDAGAAALVDRPVEVEDIGDGLAFLRVNQALPWSVAVEVLRLVKGAQEPADEAAARPGADDETP